MKLGLNRFHGSQATKTKRTLEPKVTVAITSISKAIRGDENER
jgi:hypothetical protein